MLKNAYAPDMISVCRSVTIRGRRTSIRMEREFWIGLDAICRERELSMTEVLAIALGDENNANRTAAIKTWVLAQYRQMNWTTF